MSRVDFACFDCRIDPRLLRDSPALLAISTWLETSLGINSSYFMLSILSTIAAFLGLANFNETAFRLAMSGGKRHLFR